jgi:hypothetical protein
LYADWLDVRVQWRAVSRSDRGVELRKLERELPRNATCVRGEVLDFANQGVLKLPPTFDCLSPRFVPGEREGRVHSDEYDEELDTESDQPYRWFADSASRGGRVAHGFFHGESSIAPR